MSDQTRWTPAVIERWQAWRNEDQADNAVISRSDIITLLAEIERLMALLRPFVDMVAEPEDFAAARRTLERK